MNTEARQRGSKDTGLVILPAMMIALLAAFILSPQTARCQEGDVAIEHLLPSDTMLYFCTEDGILAEELAKTMPLNKILQEQEVIDFLEKPKAFVNKVLGDLKEMAAKEEALKGVDLDIEKFWNCEIGRSFMAITHITMPQEGSAGPAGMIPDIGVIAGAEFKNPDQNIIQFGKEAAVTIANAKGFPITLTQHEYNGVAYERMNLPMFLQGMSPVFFKIGEMDVFSFSTKSMEAMIDLYMGKSTDCLAARSDFAKSLTHIDFTDPAASKAYIDIDKLIAVTEVGVAQIVRLIAMKEGIGTGEGAEHNEEVKFLMEFPDKLHKLVDVLGLRSMKAVYGTQVSRNGLATSVSYLTLDGPPTGLMGLSPDVPVTEEKLKMIPKDAVSFSIGQFDFAGLYDVVMEGIEAVHAETHAKIQDGMQGFFQGMAEKKGGEALDIRRDILGSLGTEMIYYELKPKGGMAMMMGTPPIYMFVSVKDYDKFADSLNRLFEGLGEMNPEINNFLSLKSLDYEGHPIQYMQFKSIPIPLQPTFAKCGDYLVFGFQVNDIKKLIKEFGKSETSILDNEDFQSFYAKLPKDKELLGLRYVDIKVKFAATYEQLTPIIPMITMGLPPEIELPFDFMLLPTSECITKHLCSSISASYKEGDGYQWVSYGPFGPEIGKVMLALLAGAGAAIFHFTEAEMFDEPPSAIEIESAHEEDPVDLALQAKKDMGSLAGACTVYNIEHGNFPESLDKLLEPTDGYPDGFYPPKKLPVDPWGNPYKYVRFTEGQHRYMIWSCGPDGVDDKGKGDDIVKLK